MKFSVLNLFVKPCYFSFTIHDLATEDMFLVSLDLYVCFEVSSPCMFSASILNDVKLPKTQCDWSAGIGRYRNKMFI